MAKTQVEKNIILLTFHLDDNLPHPKKVANMEKLCICLVFSEEISELMLNGTILQINNTISNWVLNVMSIKVNIQCEHYEPIHVSNAPYLSNQ